MGRYDGHLQVVVVSREGEWVLLPEGPWAVLGRWFGIYVRVRYADSTDTPGRAAGQEHSLTVAVSAVHLSRVEIVHQVGSLFLAAIRDEGLLWWYQFKAIAPLYRLR